MNNEEIKEILDTLKYCVEKNEYLEVPNMKEWKPLLDYITNLQEEIKSANESVTWWINRYEAVVRNCDETVKKMIALGEENERLQQIEKDHQKLNGELREENERLKKLIDADNESYDIQETIINRQKSELLEQQDYKSRVEKAIDILQGDKK